MLLLFFFSMTSLCGLIRYCLLGICKAWQVRGFVFVNKLYIARLHNNGGLDLLFPCQVHYTWEGPAVQLDTGTPFIKTMGPRQDGRHFPGNIFKCIFLNENVWISINISLKFVPKDPINNIPGLAQIMAWCRPGDKPLSEPMMVSLLTHICVIRPQWLNMD